MKRSWKHLQLCCIVIDIWGTCVVAGISVVVTECFMVCRVVGMCLWLSLFKPTISCYKYHYKSSCQNLTKQFTAKQF